jgi:eukaryotic-like serine/threonine-protein kinase
MWLLVAGVLVALAGSGCAREPAPGEGGRVAPPLPDVVGMTVQQAKAAIEASGFDVWQVAPDGCQSETTHVIRAYVPESSRMETGPFGVVILVGTIGSDHVTVPDVTHRRLAEAKASLRSWGLTLGSVETRFDGTEESGTVLSQKPAAGTVAPHDARVSLVLSTDKR